VDVQFLRNKGIDFGCIATLPRDLANVFTIEHIALGDTVPPTRAHGTSNMLGSVLVFSKRISTGILGLLTVALLRGWSTRRWWWVRLLRRGPAWRRWWVALLWRLIASKFVRAWLVSLILPRGIPTLCCTICLEATPILLIILLPGILVRDTTGFLHLGHGARGIDPVVVAQVIEADILHGVEASPRNRLINAVPASIDRVVLELHDGAGTQCIIALEVTSESWNGGHEYDHLVLLAITSSADNSLNDRSTNSVLDWLLCVDCRSDKELVLNVDKVLTVLDGFDVGVGDGVL
jgi:hypothetical protein